MPPHGQKKTENQTRPKKKSDKKGIPKLRFKVNIKGEDSEKTFSVYEQSSEEVASEICNYENLHDEEIEKAVEYYIRKCYAKKLRYNNTPPTYQIQ